MSHRRIEARPAPDSVICRLDEIAADLGTYRLTWFEWDGPYRVVVIRRGDRVYAYRNQCPHALAHLDHPPGDFFSLDRRHLECSFHGARFRIADGHCIAGPCKGRGLARFPIRVEDGLILVAAVEPPAVAGPASRASRRKSRKEMS